MDANRPVVSVNPFLEMSLDLSILIDDYDLHPKSPIQMMTSSRPIEKIGLLIDARIEGDRHPQAVITGLRCF